MINRQTLLSDLQKLLQKLEADLLERSMSAEVPEVGVRLKEEHERATKAQRTAQNYEDWRTDAITQAAAAWVLSCVFVRFLEDNRLIDPPKMSGPASGGNGQSEDRLGRARDEHELYFRKHPKQTDREYLLSIFDQLAKLPGTKDVFGEHNPIRELPNWLSGDAAGDLLKFFQKIDANTGALVHDFTDSNWDTRFLGDLYQDLSEAARKKYALLQTPEFVEEFILDRTLDPALDEFGLEPPPASGEEDISYDSPSRDSKLVTRRFRMIDPACGSGHFLLGSFPRILDRWMKKEPGTNVRELVQRTLHSIHGVDVNPFAIAIARFRLLLAALNACGIQRLADAPAFDMNLVCGDSLLHAPLATGGKKFTAGQQELDFALATDPSESDECDHAYRSENLPQLKRLLRGGQYHTVVANPPYIIVRDATLNRVYRQRYRTCAGKYSLAVPFLERIFRLATPSGYTGQITSNSFMKREFGKKLIEAFFPSVDLTHVIDTKGAFIPGHATPTVILFGRHRLPVTSTLRTVMGIRGEPETPADPAKGLVWSAIVAQTDQPGSQSGFVSVCDSPREQFHKHPWSIGGGGAAELKEQLEEGRSQVLSDVASTAIGLVTLEDDAYAATKADWLRRGIKSDEQAGFIEGDRVRDWEINDLPTALFPHDWKSRKPTLSETGQRLLWPLKTNLSNRLWFRKTQVERGLAWFEYGMLSGPVTCTPMSIAYGEIATHNHFVLDRGGKVFKQTAPVIKLPREASEDDHLALLGLLNSSTACFWMKQVAHEKQMMGGEGIRIESKAKVPYAFSGTQLGKMPIPEAWRVGPLRERLLSLTRRMDQLASRLSELTAQRSIELGLGNIAAMRETWQQFQDERQYARSQMILLQEEIDFTVYVMCGFADRSLLSANLDWPNVMLDAGDRPFDILRGCNEDNFPVPNGIPAPWSADLRDLWQRRIDAISKSSELRLIEDPHYKRRWIGRQGKYNLKRDVGGLDVACVSWLLNRLESYSDFDGRMNDTGQPTAKLDMGLVSVARLASIAGQDADFLQVGELYRDDAAFDVQALVTELVAPECVPLLPVLRYKPAGLIKRTTWERTWDLQRQEDAIDARTQLPATDPNYLTEEAAKTLKEKQVGKIPVPTKYDSKDFLTSDFWRLRGKLDVPKERWISFPHCNGPDGTMMLCWAGYDHLQQARAISAYYVQVQTEFGGSDDPRLIPLLACLIELLPWLKQWHNDLDPEFNMSMGDYFEGFINEEARQLGKTLQEIKDWVPPAKAPGRRKRSTK